MKEQTSAEIRALAAHLLGVRPLTLAELAAEIGADAWRVSRALCADQERFHYHRGRWALGPRQGTEAA